MEERRIVVVGGGMFLQKAELMELLGKHVIVESFTPAHSVAYSDVARDAERLRQEFDKMMQAPSTPPVDNCNTMRQFVRSHMRKGRR